MGEASRTALSPEGWHRALELFHAALERPPAERAELLDREGAGAPELRREVESLLQAYAEDPGFLEGAAAHLPEGLALPEAESVEARQVGPYRLLRRIGEGGMGAVYLAERADEQFRKQVAVKLVKPGMDSDELLRRFQAERQILASLDHPNIARLLDGGRTEEGRPYLVMEYVAGGVPLDEYCRRRKLSVAERLGLFRTVCAAVQSAHQSLVVHRDLKPSNIQISADGRVKLLDFGIAKLLDPEASEAAALRTRTGALLMTPEYASPEQVLGQPITTASDVYSLGVLLYELLSGHLPYRLRSRSFEEVVRSIVEEEPERPSTAARRPTEPRGQAEQRAGAPDTEAAAQGIAAERLARELRGDLDNIVLMALRKDPRERYASAEALSEDLLRFVEHRPVLARKETVGYVLRKFVRRHRMGVAAAAVAAASLLVGLAGTVWQAELARQERDRARLEAWKAEQVSSLIVGLFESSDPTKQMGTASLPVRTVLERGEKQVLEKLDGQPDVQATMLHVLGRVYHNLGAYDRAQELFESALEKRRALHRGEHAEVAETLHELSRALFRRSKFEEAERTALEALAMRRQLYGEEHQLVAQSLVLLGNALASRDPDSGEPERLYRQALAIQTRQLGEENLETAKTANDLAILLNSRGRYDESEALYRRVLAIVGKLQGKDHLDFAGVADNFAVLLVERGDYDEAAKLRQNVLEVKRKWLGDEHPAVATSLMNLGVLSHFRGDHDGALPYLTKALELWRKAFGPEHGNVALSLNNLGMVLAAKGDLAESEALLGEALAIRLKLYGENHPVVAHQKLNLATTLNLQGRFEEAERLLRAALEVWQEGEDQAHLLVGRCRGELGRALFGQGRLGEAEQALEQAVGLLRKLFPQGHPDLASVLLTLGELLLERGSVEQAEAAAREALQIRKTKLAPQHWQIAQARSLLGACLAAGSRREEGRALLHESCAELCARRGTQHFSSRTACRRLVELERRNAAPAGAP
jgi:serine/threonine-protein kinase